MTFPTRPLRRAEASVYLKEKHGIDRAPATLAKQRLTGAGVPYTQLGGNVLYSKRDCEEYLVSRRRLSTSDARPEAL